MKGLSRRRRTVAEVGDDTFMFFDDLASNVPIDVEGAKAWLDEALGRMDAGSTFITFGFCLPNEVAERFEPGDLTGPLRYAFEHGILHATPEYTENARRSQAMVESMKQWGK